MAKKKRKATSNITSVLNFIYITACVVYCVISLGGILVFPAIAKKIVFADPSAVALNQESQNILLIIFFFAFSLAMFVLYNKNKNLFWGQSQAGIYEQENKMLYTKFGSGNAEKNKTKILKNIAACILIFVILFYAVFFSIYPRTVLCKNDEIKTYDYFNNVTETRNIQEADTIIVHIELYRTRRESYYYIENVFIFSDKQYSFASSSFGDMTNEEILEYMLRLKSDFAEKYVVRDTALVEELCQDQHFTEAEKALVYELFDYTK